MLNDSSKLVWKSDYDTNIIEIENKIPNYPKHITTLEFNKLTKENFDERLKQVNLAMILMTS